MERKCRFDLGDLYITPGAMSHLSHGTVLASLGRHARGDWGIVSDDDKTANDESLKDGSRLLSAYIEKESGTKFWIITEADRSATTVLLPEEY